MNKKFFIFLSLICLTLSSCDGSLLNSSSLKLDDNEINQVELGYLNSRSAVSGIAISISLDESPLSDTITLASQSVSSKASVSYNLFSNHALSYSVSYQDSTTSSATGFTTLNNRRELGYSWLGLVSDEEGNEAFYHYDYANISYNNGYISNNSTLTGPIEKDSLDTYWGAYYIDLFYSSIFKTYIDETDSFGNSLYDTFSGIDLFGESLTYTWQKKGSVVNANYSLYRQSYITNPLYPSDYNSRIPALDLYDITYTFTNDKNFGYILSNVSYSYEYELLENFENHYLSNPRIIKTYQFDATYSYSQELGYTTVPNIDTTSAIFVPLLSTYQYEDDDSEQGYSVTRISTSNPSDTINMSRVISDIYPSFDGYCYEIGLSVIDTSYRYAFTSTLNTALEDPIYNSWGHSYIDLGSLPNGLIESDVENFFKINAPGNYSFRLFFDLEYNLINIQVLVLSYY